MESMRVIEVINAVDLHADRESGRVIVGGVLDVLGASMFEKMQYLRTHRDHVRKRMLSEPRGYPAANCNVILPPTRPAPERLPHESSPDWSRPAPPVGPGTSPAGSVSRGRDVHGNVMRVEDPAYELAQHGIIGFELFR